MLKSKRKVKGNHQLEIYMTFLLGLSNERTFLVFLYSYIIYISWKVSVYENFKDAFPNNMDKKTKQMSFMWTTHLSEMNTFLDATVCYTLGNVLDSCNISVNNRDKNLWAFETSLWCERQSTTSVRVRKQHCMSKGDDHQGINKKWGKV